MGNPYSNRPDFTFWTRAVSRLTASDVDPVVSAKFQIGRDQAVATAGSCFAQHIARALVKDGYGYLVTEPGPIEANYGLFPARFGNIYSTRQLLQLFQRAYGLFEPSDVAWTRPDCTFVDPFRPQVEPNGFSSIVSLNADREIHFSAVRKMFETCDVLIFTLGLTEAWISSSDGAVFPLAPGVVASPASLTGYEFRNFPVSEMIADLKLVIEMMRSVNVGAKVILTVSPVPLIATYEDRHVLVSTIYSKSALRVVAEVVTQEVEGVAYFPSYEIITGPHARYGYFADDLRSVTPAGVERVMGLFRRHYLREAATDATTSVKMRATAKNVESDEAMSGLYQVVCDEEAIEK